MNKANSILFVVHRYAPFPGGSEINVQNMAEEMLRRGYDVTVLAHEHKGDLNGVKVTNDYNILGARWKLIIVHGGDVISQNIAHVNSFTIKSPILYLIIKPSESQVCLHGLKHCKFVAYGTSMDIDHIKKFGYTDKARRVRYGLNTNITISKNPKKYAKKTFVSAGGFSPHKAMVPLAEAFERLGPENTELHLYGYGLGQLPNETDRVKVFFDKSKEEVIDAIAGADAYIMNSYEEGFGLVLLEAMMNKTPWLARNIAGAKDMSKYGHTYETEEQLMYHLNLMKALDTKVDIAYNYAMSNHTIVQCVNDIEDIILETIFNA